MMTLHPWNSVGQNSVMWSHLTVREARTVVRLYELKERDMDLGKSYVT